MAETILVVDDEEDVLDLVLYNVRKAGYKTLWASDGQTALQKAQNDLPDLVILDLMLPKLDGTQVCKMLKADPKTADIPIIMLTAKADEVDRVVGLEIGADDYITKPFSPRELLLRMRLILKRSRSETKSSEVLRCGDLVLDTARHALTLNNREIVLTVTEFKLLSTLMERRGRVQSRDRLLTDVWGYEGDVDTRTVDTHVRRIREKLGTAGDYIETVRGVGYRFCAAG